MNNYAYAYLIEDHADEVQFAFRKFPEIISFMPKSIFLNSNSTQIEEYTSDAVLTALQTRITSRNDIPDSDKIDNTKADGFVLLHVQQAMKLELYKLYKSNSKSITDFSKHIEKKETTARRLLNLRHQSWTTEIEAAIMSFGKVVFHSWEVRGVTPSLSKPMSVRHPSPS